MKAYKYIIQIDDINGKKKIKEVAIPEYGAIINRAGIHFPKYINGRHLNEAINKKEIEISEEIAGFILFYKNMKEEEEEIIKRLGVQDD